LASPLRVHSFAEQSGGAKPKGKEKRNFEIGRVLHFKAEIRNLKLNLRKRRGLGSNLRSCDFGFEMQDSSDFAIPYDRFMAIRKKQTILALLFVISGVSLTTVSAQDTEFNSLLFQTTFKIEGPGFQSGTVTLGTVFLMSRPIPDSNKFQTVLITARHVLDGIRGDTATLNLRRKTQAGWQRVRYPVKIRDAGQAVWVGPDDVDVAVMDVRLPEAVQIPIISTEILANDEMLTQFEVHPGDELTCLGYPFGAESNAAGFAILRSGKIASFPLLPTEKTHTFLFDFEIFPGNSGGPVYLSANNRWYGGRMHTGETVHFIVGLITQQLSENLTSTKERLSLASVVHASLIRKAVAMLPDPPKE